MVVLLFAVGRSVYRFISSKIFQHGSYLLCLESASKHLFVDFWLPFSELNGGHLDEDWLLAFVLFVSLYARSIKTPRRNTSA